MNNFTLLQRRLSDSTKFECAEFKSELPNLVLPTIFNGKDIQDLCMSKMLLQLIM